MNKKEEFIRWLSSNTELSDASIRKYASGINAISQDLNSIGTLHGNLFIVI